MITQEYLKSKVEYDPVNGYFSSVRTGHVYLAKCPQGYILVKIDRKTYKAHRIAFLYMTGKIPDEIDHKNNIRDDNRWKNLREATRQQNVFNSPMHKDNAVGYKGVSYRKSRGHYKAIMKLNGKELYLGSFDNPEDAAKAYQEAALRYHGEFAKW